MKTVRKTPLVLLAVCLAVIALLCAGCKKNTGWKAQSSPAVSPSASEQQSTAKPTSYTVSSFLHDLFGGELPA